MSALPVKRACDLADSADQPGWLIENLWADQAVGILGGEPKCCKSFLALDMAVSIASGTACLRRFRALRTAPVLLYPAEDSMAVVRQRLDGICAAASTRLDLLPIFVITAPRLLLDLPQDREQLRQTVAEINPAMLILDPFIRLHRSDENASKEVAPLLGYLRELQRELKVAVLLVHHVRKGSAATKRPGQALRGSSDLHGWGDSNLYLRRNGSGLLLSIEHRAAPSRDNIPVDLCANGSALALTAKTGQEHTSSPATTSEKLSPSRRVILAMKEISEPVSVQELRKLCRMRTSTLCEILAILKDRGDVMHGPHGYSLASHQCKTAVSLPDTPIDSSGNGNGKPLRQLSFR